MDSFALCVFLFAAFLGGFASGLAGFAMGFVVAGFWLHIITPIETAVLITGYGFFTQGYGVWKLRQSLDIKTLLPFIVGGIFGVPFGTWLLTYVSPAYMRTGVGVLLLIFSIHGLAKPAFKPLHVDSATDGGVGFLNGALCGLTGFPGLIITIWCQLRPWAKDVQRAVFQPVMLAAIAATGISLAIAGAITTDVIRLYLLGLPALLAGLWIGFKLYGKLDDATFRKLILVMLFCAGLALVASQIF